LAYELVAIDRKPLHLTLKKVDSTVGLSKKKGGGGGGREKRIIIIIICRVAARILVTGKGLAFFNGTVQRIRMSLD
jgi:hypothetical protein